VLLTRVAVTVVTGEEAIEALYPVPVDVGNALALPVIVSALVFPTVTVGAERVIVAAKALGVEIAVSNEAKSNEERTTRIRELNLRDWVFTSVEEFI
jgi:hypothetical protein